MSAIETITHHSVHNASELIDGVKDKTALAVGKSAAGTVGGAAAGTTLGYGGIHGFTLPVIGLTAAVSASITQIEHQRKMKRVAQFYKNEIASMLGKDPKKVTADDLEIMSRGSILNQIKSNPVIAEELGQSKKRRNFGLILSVAASVVTLAVLGLAAPGVHALTGGVATAVGASSEGLLQTIAHSIIGLATYYTVKAPMHWVGDKVLGLDKETTHERIDTLFRERQEGRVIGKEQVFGLFVTANPDIASVIKNKYGKAYDDLPLTDKQRLTHNMGRLLEVDRITEAINNGTMAISELAFAVSGQASGAQTQPVEEPKQGIVSKVKEKLHGVAEHLTHKEEKAPPSFADRIKRKPAAGEMTHLERLEQARAAGPLTTER